MNLTQQKEVENHLLTHGTITSWGAIQNYRITRLSQYILILRNSGWDIDSIWKKTKTRWAWMQRKEAKTKIRRWTEYKLISYPNQ